MEYRRLGQSGLQVSALGLGSWTTYGRQVGAGAAESCVRAAYDAGVNLFDSAEGYADGQAETILGGIFKKYGWRRDTLVISTKVFWGGELPNQFGLSRKHILEACAASLGRLGVEYLDLYLCHRPDPNTPIEETVRAMDHLVRQGRVLYWGTSCWERRQVEEAHEVARREHLTPPGMEQPPYSMFARERVERELAPLCDRIGLGLTTYSPLFGGVLSGKYAEGIPEGSRAAFRGPEWVRDHLGGEAGQRRRRQVAELRRLATRLGTTPARLAIAWCLANPRVSSVLTGASRPEQVADNLGAVALRDGALNAGVLAEIDTLLNGPIPAANAAR
ncbi:MAG: aldo/keto reductase [Nitrospirae bacterium]|nr:aldo/keto reductase [Nitrospirota bacterium]